MDKKCFSFNAYDDEPTDVPNLIPYTKFNSFDVHSPDGSGSPYHDTDSLSDKSKKIRKKRNTYQKIDDETRIKLLDAVQQGDTLKAAAKRYSINYSSAKSILHTFRKEGRILKKSAQERTVRKRSKASPDIEMSPIYLSQYQHRDYHDTHNFKFCSSPEFKPKTQLFELSGSEGLRQVHNGPQINSFGGFLRIGPQTPQKVENLNTQKSPTKTIVLNLEPQRLKSADGKPIQTGGWQLNVNVHDNNAQKNQQKPVQEPQYAMNQAIRTQEKPRNPMEGYNLGYQAIPQMIKREEIGRDPRFNNFTNVMNGMEDMNTAAQEQAAYDVSCYLESSPAYSFHQQRVAEMEHYNHNNQGNLETFSSAIDSLRGVVEPQYHGLAKGAYMGNYGLKLEEGNAALIKAAGLRSY